MDGIIGTMTANEAQIEGTGESRYNPIPIHHTRRTERDGEIPVSWILRKLFKTILATQFFDNITRWLN